MINALDSQVKSGLTVFPWLHFNSNIALILFFFFFIYVMLLLYLHVTALVFFSVSLKNVFSLGSLLGCLCHPRCVPLGTEQGHLSSRRGKPWFLRFSPRPSELSVLCPSFDRQHISLFHDSTLATDKLVIFLLLNHVLNFVPAAGKYERLKDSFKSNDFKPEVELIYKNTTGKVFNDFTFGSQFRYSWSFLLQEKKRNRQYESASAWQQENKLRPNHWSSSRGGNERNLDSDVEGRKHCLSVLQWRFFSLWSLKEYVIWT